MKESDIRLLRHIVEIENKINPESPGGKPPSKPRVRVLVQQRNGHSWLGG